LAVEEENNGVSGMNYQPESIDVYSDNEEEEENNGNGEEEEENEEDEED